MKSQTKSSRSVPFFDAGSRRVLLGGLLLGLVLGWVLDPLAPGTTQAASLDLGAQQVGLSLGNSPRWTGLRLNFSDHELEEITGLDVTLWRPGRSPEGRVRGVGVGLWGTGAARLEGLHVGGIGIDAARRFDGVGVALLGLAVGNDGGHSEYSETDASAHGLLIGGVGMAIGTDLAGIGIGGVGATVGRDARGIMVGGVGMSVGRDLSGLATAGLGFSVGRNARGLLVSGIGAAVGGSFSGISVAGIGLALGDDARGLLLSGIGLGVAHDLEGLALGGIGLGVGERLSGLGIGGLAVEAQTARGVLLAGIKTRGQALEGFAMSAYNKWDDRVEGLSVGLVNVTRELHGVQLGLLNVVWDNPRGRRYLPLVNWGG